MNDPYPYNILNQTNNNNQRCVSVCGCVVIYLYEDIRVMTIGRIGKTYNINTEYRCSGHVPYN